MRRLWHGRVWPIQLGWNPWPRTGLSIHIDVHCPPPSSPPEEDRGAQQGPACATLRGTSSCPNPAWCQRAWVLGPLWGLQRARDGGHPCSVWDGAGTGDRGTQLHPRNAQEMSSLGPIHTQLSQARLQGNRGGLSQVLPDVSHSALGGQGTFTPHTKKLHECHAVEMCTDGRSPIPRIHRSAGKAGCPPI